MKELTIQQMSNLNGGGWIGGFCGVLGGGSVIAYLMGVSVVTGGVGGIIVGTALVGCAIYGLYNINN